MSEFVDECRREWRRLGVPDPIANEMAADLTADLDEAAAEGHTAEDVLGNSAFDPRRFAASWATARGVTSAPVVSEAIWRRRQPLVIGLAAAALLAVCGGVGLLLVRFHGSVSVAASGLARNHLRFVKPGLPPELHVGPGGGIFLPLGQGGGVGVPLVAVLLFVAGVICLVLALAYYGSPWLARYRSGRGRGGPPTPSWH